ncbi:MAG: hypothetical protein GOU97_04130 [Nanoarchaeota archaeon]|nr:hypothetical protein [Nanoarchaeota archaeon]
MKYDLEIDKIIREIREHGYKTVLLQFPDGLKSHATSVAEQIRNGAKAKVLVWVGSNYGACDIPDFKADLLVNFGHSKMKF